jgi:dTDP-4-dehydrorhamnose 3,5-epimerase
MKFFETKLRGSYEIHLDKKGDERGWLMRTFDSDLFKKNIPNFNGQWVQMNHTFNASKHTWRGFHYQKSPYEESKVVRCTSGKVLDCVLDLRVNSKTYLQTYQCELSSTNGVMLFIPKGCAHGYITLEDNTELVYMHDEFYNPECELGVRFDDKKINFSLPIQPKVISERDKNHQEL